MIELDDYARSGSIFKLVSMIFEKYSLLGGSEFRLKPIGLNALTCSCLIHT